MNKQILIFVSLISIILSTYRPMTKRTIDFGENVCYYKDYDSGSNTHSYFEYVKPCPQGKFCYPVESSTSHGGSYYNLHTCEPFAQSRKVYGAACDTNFECSLDYDVTSGPDYIFQCSNKICTLKSTDDYTSTYKVKDSLSNDLIIYHCPSNKYPLSDSSSDGISCISLPSGVQESSFSGKYMFTLTSTSTIYYAGGKSYQVPGLLHFKEVTATNTDYIVDSIDYSDIGTVEDGHFVSNPLACKSGFALYFFGNGQLTKTTGITNMYPYCVTIKEYISSNEVVYSISGGDEKVYNQAQIAQNEGIIRIGTNSQFSPNLLTKLEMFKNYKEKLDIEKCRGEYDYSEPFTCKNNEVRKWWYFYHNPEEYLLYKDEQMVMDYLVQQTFHEYASDSASESSGFLAFKYLLCLLILLSL